MSLFLNLSSRDSLALQPENTWHDFTVELPRSIEGKFQCALMEFACASSMLEELYVFSDICTPEFVADSVQPLLRIVTEEGEVSHPYFKAVSRQVIQRVRIFIRNRNLNVPIQSVGSVRVTLSLETI